jgi:hypothetical protein
MPLDPAENKTQARTRLPQKGAITKCISSSVVLWISCASLVAGEIARVGQWIKPELPQVRSISCSAAKAYFTSGGGLQVVDISSPTNPIRVGGTSTYTYGLAVSGNYAYFTGYGGFQVADISNPSAPVRIGGITNIGTSGSLTLLGNRVYLAAPESQATLYVIDVADPANPVQIGKTNFTGLAQSIAVSGNYVFMGVGFSLRVLDVSTPSTPFLVGAFFLTNSPVSIAVSGNLAYVAVDASGLHVIDVSNPANPVRVGGTQATNSLGGQLVLAGSYIYMADSAGLEVIDVSNPTMPVIVSRYFARFQPAYSIGLLGNYAYLGGYAGIDVIDISNPANPVRVGGLLTTSSATLSVAHSNDRAYLVDQFAGLQVIDTSNPWKPTLAGSYYTGGAPFDIAVSGSYAYMLDYSNGLQVFSITNPAGPVLMGAWTTTNVMETLAVFGNYAYVAHHTSSRAGMSVVNVSVPTNPVGVATYWVSNPPNSQVTHAGRVAASGNYVYLPYGGIEFASEFGDASIGNVESINVSNPTNPIYAGSVYAFNHIYFDVPQSLDVAISGNYAYDVYHQNPRAAPYTNEFGGLAAIDISTPTNPILRTMFETHQKHSQVAISGNFAYMLGGSPDFRAIDISNPTNMALVASTNTGGLRMAVSGHYAYFASGAQGLQIYCLDCPRLSAEPAGGQVLLKWPPSSVTYSLESAQSIVNPQWQPVPGTPQLMNGFYQLLIPATPPGAFLRLHGQ